MKILRTLLVCGLLAAVTQMAAQKRVLTVDPVTIQPGDTSDLVVNMDYDTNETLTGYNFSLYLPEGVDLNITDWKNGELSYSQIKQCCTLSERMYPVLEDDEWDPREALYVSLRTDGGRLVLWIDTYNRLPLKSTHGELIRFKVKASNTFTGGTGEIKDIALANDKSQSLDVGNIANVRFPINIGTPTPDPEELDTDISQLSNIIYASHAEVKAGAEETLALRMKNTAAIRGFQFNLTLPQGVTAVRSAKGKIQASLNSARLPEDDEHTLGVSEQADGSLLFLCGSQYDETFTGTDGDVLTLKVKVAEGMADGDYPLLLTNVKLSETDISKYYEASRLKSTLTVSSYMTGDINGDQKIDVSDYIGVANRILGNTPEGFIEKAADVDENGVIDVSDYIGVANIILSGNIYNGNTTRARKANTDLSAKDNVIYIEPFQAEAGSEVQMSLKMKNTAPIRGFQFNLVLPEGVTVATNSNGRIQAKLSAGRLPQEDEHTLAAREQADGSVLFLCGSQYDENFTGNDGEIATVTLNVSEDIAAGDHALFLKNIKLTETDISKYYETAEVETTLTIGGQENPEGKNGEKWGDVNNDGMVDVSDIATIISIMSANARLQMELEK